MNTKSIGVILIGICIVFLFVMTSFVNEINHGNESSCGCPTGECPMSNDLPLYAYLGFFIALLLGILGVYVILTARGMEREYAEKEKKLAEQVKSLDEDEKKIYEEIYRADGVVFQAELVKETELPKAKVSRVLDRLENKGLLERRRKGLNNLVLLRKQ